LSVRRFAFVVVAACSSRAQPAYPLHPAVRSATGGPVEITGAVVRPCNVPYAPGLTLRTALQLAGGVNELGMRDAEITRGATRFEVPVQAIVAGEAPDPELAPGDRVVVEAARIAE
jgi:protein involved in polysaccharide export with SLBB domain